MPASNFIVIPKVSSDRRAFIPIGFETPQTLASDLVFLIPEAQLLHFGILTSTMHNTWMRAVAGRLGNGYRYSAGIVYNNFPWPNPNDKQREQISKMAQGVLDARALYPDASLADLYDPLTMPPELVKAHAQLDKAVDAAYGYKGAHTDAERVAFLFGLYQQLIGALATVSDRQPKRKRVKSSPAPQDDTAV